MRTELSKGCLSDGQGAYPTRAWPGTVCTHLRNTELGLSVELCGASTPFFFGLPGISNRNTLSLDDILFFTIVTCPLPRNKLKSSFLKLPNKVKICFSSAQFLQGRKGFT
jgi:hypothetical protein